MFSTFRPIFSFPKFLGHVVRGEQKYAAALLKEAKDEDAMNHAEGKNSTILLNLLETKSTVTDLSGRTFNGITAFQYALWALDRDMWQMLLTYLPKTMLLKQYQEYVEHGVSYTLEGRIINEKYYDFLLITALEEFYRYMDGQKHLSLNQLEADKMWCVLVGVFQRYIPAHIAQEYFRRDRSFFPIPSFKGAVPRVLISQDFYVPELGSLFAVIKGRDVVRRENSAIKVWLENTVLTNKGEILFLDLEAMKMLRQTRMEEYATLSNMLNEQLSHITVSTTINKGKERLC